MNLCLNGSGNGSDLAVLLQNFTGDVQRQILTVDKARHKPVVIRDQFLGFIHDEYTLGIQLQTRLKITVVEVVRGLAGNEQKGGIGDISFHIVVDDFLRVLPVIELCLVEFIVFFRCDVFLIPLP